MCFQNLFLVTLDKRESIGLVLFCFSFPPPCFCFLFQKGVIWMVLVSYPERRQLELTRNILSKSTAISLAAGEHPVCIRSSSLVAPPSVAATASTARLSRNAWHTLQSTATAASPPSLPAFTILPTTAVAASAPSSQIAARPSAHPAAASITRSARLAVACGATAGSALNTRARAGTTPAGPARAEIPARHPSPASTARRSIVAPFSSDGPISRISSLTSSSFSAIKTLASESDAAMIASRTLAASICDSKLSPSLKTRIKAETDRSISETRSAIAIFLLQSSMKSEVRIKAKTLATATELSDLESFRTRMEARTEVHPPTPTRSFFSIGSTSLAEKNSASLRSGGTRSSSPAEIETEESSCRRSLARRRGTRGAGAAEEDQRRSLARRRGTRGAGAAEEDQRWMRRWRVRLGTRSVEGSGSIVAGHVVFPDSSHRWMEARS
ncbi:hypothetical protein C4D60_Mb06t18420 [Musa balbisiana]|uniref:Uncharacterized protein n=1 Tax=Musa balbisiana TaxID=52838 RepID=A0A4S8IP01_MUSBA|nr:hypothetical protein C4D60_Mb06t18420 [Musa balbisiana]